MSIVEIHKEALQRTKSKLRNHLPRIFGLSLAFTVFLTFCFYYFEIGDFGWDIAKSHPLFITVLVGTQTFFGMLNLQLLLTYFWSFGESTHSQVKNSLEQRRQKKIQEEAKAVRNQFNQYGHQDYSLQIDEAKQGLEHKISGNENLISELSRRFNIKSLATDWRVSRLERKVSDLESQLQKKDENSVPLEEFERLSARLLKVEEELRNLKGE